MPNSNLIYVVAALLVLGSLAYRLARREPISRVAIGGAVVAVVSLLAYSALQAYHPIAAEKIALDYQALNATYTCFSQTVAVVASTSAVGLSTVFTALTALAPFTLGTTEYIAFMIAEAVVAAVNAYVDAVAYWLGQAAAMVGILRTAVELGPAISAAMVPLIAAYMPSRRSAFVAAYLSLVPWMLALAVYLSPVVQPMPSAYCSTQFPPMPPGQAVVGLNSTQPTIFLFGTHYGNWSAVWIAEGPGKALLPAPATYNTTAVWMWIKVPAKPSQFYLRPQNATLINATCAQVASAYGANATLTNATCPLVGYNQTELTVVAGIPQYAQVDQWNYAVSPAPKYTKWVAIGSGPDRLPRLELVWEYTYGCYGNASQCPTVTYHIAGVGLFWKAFVSAETANYATYDYSVSITNDSKAITAEQWKSICGNSTGACPPYPSTTVYGEKYYGPKDLDLTVTIRPTPYEECQWVNGTLQCTERPTWHSIVVNVTVVLFTYEGVPQGVAGFYATQGNKTANAFDALALLKQLLQGTSLASVLSTISPAGDLLAGYNFVDQVLVKPAFWIANNVVPWFIEIAYLELIVLGSALGLGILVGADALLPRLVYFEELMRRARYTFDPFGHVFRIASTAASSAGAGASPYAQVYTNPYVDPYKKVAESTLKTADMAKLYLSTAMKVAGLVWSGDILDFALAAGGIAALLPYMWREVLVSRSSRLWPVEQFGLALGKAVHHYFTPSGHAIARRIRDITQYLHSAFKLRIDRFSTIAARHLNDAYQHNLEVFGNRLTATAATLLHLRALSPTEAAAFAIAFGLESRYYPILPKLVAEELKLRYFMDVKESDVLRLWFERTGHDPRIVDFFLAVAKTLGEDKEKYLVIAASAPTYSRELWAAYARLVPEELLPVAERYAPGVMEQELLRRYGAIQSLDQAIFEGAAKFATGTKAADAAAAYAREVYAASPERGWKALYDALAEKLDLETRRAAGGYDVLVFKDYAYVRYGGTATREQVEELKKMGFVITGEAWREFGGIPPESAPIVWKGGKEVDVNYVWLAWQNYDVRVDLGERKVVVNFGGESYLDDVVETVLRFNDYKLEGNAAGYIAKLVDSPYLAKALFETEDRKKVEETAARFFQQMDDEEREAIRAFLEEVAKRRAEEETIQALGNLERLPMPEPAAEPKPQELTGVQPPVSPIEPKAEEVRPTAPAPTERIEEQPRVEEVRPATETPPATKAEPPLPVEEPTAWRVYREAEERYGIDVPYEVAERYVERYGEDALDAIVRDAAKLLAESYNVPYAAKEVEELIRKYGLEETSSIVAQAKREAKETGEDLRDVLKRYL